MMSTVPEPEMFTPETVKKADVDCIQGREAYLKLEC